MATPNPGASGRPPGREAEKEASMLAVVVNCGKRFLQRSSRTVLLFVVCCCVVLCVVGWWVGGWWVVGWVVGGGMHVFKKKIFS